MTLQNNDRHNRHGCITACRLALFFALACLVAIVAAAPAQAKYNFDGFPLTLAAQGQIQGQVLTFQTLGLTNPPVSCQLTLPGDVAWAKAYVGVWGSSPDYHGWADLQVNGNDLGRTPLMGTDDTQDNVYLTGYGVYWISCDVTGQLKPGANTVSVNTSYRDPDSKIDGRVYALVVVAAVKEPDGPVTTYRVAEGNVNLHGYGWTGDANAAELDNTTVSFGNVGAAEGHANLTIVELATTRGQPDYLLLNGADLGNAPSDPADYLPGAKDIGDEQSFDAGYVYGQGGIDTRNVDMEVFNVTGIVGKDNNLTFQRGRDLNGDGVITTTGTMPEGEDYIHPALAVLTVENPAGGTPGPDLAVSNVTVSGAYAGTNGTITAALLNYGAATDSPAQVTFSADGQTIAVRPVTVSASGVQQVSAEWPATAGSHVIRVEAHVDGDTDLSNDAAEKDLVVGTLPDLVLTMDEPVSVTPVPAKPSAEPYALLAAAAGMAIAAFLVARRPPGKRLAVAILATTTVMLTAALVLALLTSPSSSMATAQSDSGESLLPVTVENLGGSDAPAFNVTLIVDGYRTVEQQVDGLAAGNETTLDLALYVTPGAHHVKAVADAEDRVMEADKANNVAEADYDFG